MFGIGLRASANLPFRQGATHAKTVANAASETDVVVLCVTDHEATTSALRNDEVAAALNGKIVVQLSTVSADDSLELASWVEKHGARYLDGGILGLPREIENHDCTIVYSGSSSLFKEVESVLECMGGRPRLISDKAGIAPLFAQAVHACYYSHTLGLFFGAAICKSIGAPLDVYFEFYNNHWAWQVDDKRYAENIMADEFEHGGATLDIFHSSFSGVMPLCEQLGLDTGLPKFIDEFFARGVKAGHGEKDGSILFKQFLEKS